MNINIPIKVKEAVIVEGKYDKIKLLSILDAVVIETNGFRIFKDKEKISIIKKLADKCGILIITDSDSAGFLIRNHIKGIVPATKIKHAYIPDLYGKEKRKSKPSKEGKLGVEGVSAEVIVNALKKSGIIFNNDVAIENEKKITQLDFYDYGLLGAKNSCAKRKALLKYLELPEYLSTKALLEVINILLNYNEYIKLCETKLSQI